MSLIVRTISMGVVFVGGVLAALIAAAGYEDSATYHSVGVYASLACALSILAMIRRSWARVPLVIAAALAGGTAWDAFFGERDPSESTLLGFLVSQVLVALLAVVALAIVAWEHATNRGAVPELH